MSWNWQEKWIGLKPLVSFPNEPWQQSETMGQASDARAWSPTCLPNLRICWQTWELSCFPQLLMEMLIKHYSKTCKINTGCLALLPLAASKYVLVDKDSMPLYPPSLKCLIRTLWPSLLVSLVLESLKSSRRAQNIVNKSLYWSPHDRKHGRNIVLTDLWQVREIRNAYYRWGWRSSKKANYLSLRSRGSFYEVVRRIHCLIVG